MKPYFISPAILVLISICSVLVSTRVNLLTLEFSIFLATTLIVWASLPIKPKQVGRSEFRMLAIAAFSFGLIGLIYVSTFLAFIWGAGFLAGEQAFSHRKNSLFFVVSLIVLSASLALFSKYLWAKSQTGEQK